MKIKTAIPAKIAGIAGIAGFMAAKFAFKIDLACAEHLPKKLASSFKTDTVKLPVFERPIF